MAYQYLYELGLNEAEVEKLSALGARTASALLSIVEYSPQLFEQFFSPQRTRDLVAALKKIVPRDDRYVPDFPPGQPQFGALQTDPGDFTVQQQAERDTLMREIQQLRQANDPQNEKRIRELEDALRTKLRAAAG